MRSKRPQPHEGDLLASCVFPHVLLRAFVILACLGAFIVRADYSVYMFIQNIPGEVTDVGHTNWIALDSISQQQVSQLIAPGVKSYTFDVNKNLDKSSPLLMLSAAQGTQVAQVHLQMVDKLNANHVYDMFLTRPFVTGVSQASSDQVLENVSFKFDQITWTYTYTTGTGKPQTATATYDLTQTNALANQTYQGNGNTNSGGAIGGGTLVFTNDAYTVYGTFTKGAGTFSNALVLYIDNGTGGFSDTSGFNDSADAITRAVSGVDGGGNRSPLTFTNAAKPFSPSYAIALAPIVGAGSGNIYQLQNGNVGSQRYIGSANLTPLGTGNAYTYKFSFGMSQVGLPAFNGQSFRFLGTYVTTTGARSTEAIGGNVSGLAGWNPFSTIDVATYTITAPAATAVAITMTYDPQAATLTFSWPETSTPYVLQQNADLNTTQWATVTNQPTVIGNQNQVVVPASPTSVNFYRLKY